MGDFENALHELAKLTQRLLDGTAGTVERQAAQRLVDAIDSAHARADALVNPTGGPVKWRQ